MILSSPPPSAHLNEENIHPLTNLILIGPSDPPTPVELDIVNIPSLFGDASSDLNQQEKLNSVTPLPHELPKLSSSSIYRLAIQWSLGYI